MVRNASPWLIDSDDTVMGVVAFCPSAELPYNTVTYVAIATETKVFSVLVILFGYGLPVDIDMVYKDIRHGSSKKAVAIAQKDGGVF